MTLRERPQALDAESIGARCRLRNPFEGEAAIYRDGVKSGTRRGSLPELATRKGEKIVVVAANHAPADFRRSLP
ncbi:MAG TPA: hypothetical protein VHC90_00340 [Bryobacteraceae bacterium]|nr:hypothetical protein [Bryobacteraceae bacterium]